LAGIIFYNKLNPIYEQRTLLLLALFSIAMYRIVPSINKILISLSQIQAYAYSVSEVSEVINAEIAPRFQKASISFENDIVFKSVSFHYPGMEKSLLLKDINIKIRKGDFVVINGPSGVGKTTLLHLMAGLISEYTGEIDIDGIALSPDAHQSWQSNIGLVPQATIVLQATLMKNIAFAENDDNIDMSRLESAIEQSGLSEFVSRLPMQLRTPIGENGLTLSGGQRQRLVLARALYRNPSVLLLDEVVNQLDEESKLKILRTLKDLTQSGKTIILASHDSVVKSFASRIFCVEYMTLVETNAILS
jgi:ABC-type bacteriocin/lantibiotic exporter with double-glycine peptidase domain